MKALALCGFLLFPGRICVVLHPTTTQTSHATAQSCRHRGRTTHSRCQGGGRGGSRGDRGGGRGPSKGRGKSGSKSGGKRGVRGGGARHLGHSSKEQVAASPQFFVFGSAVTTPS